MNKIKMIKFLDRVFGRFMCEVVIAFSFFKKPRPDGSPPVPENPSKMLIIRPGGIGDTALLFPLLSALKTRFPSCGIHLLAEKRNAGVFQTNSLAEQVYLRDKWFPCGLWTALRTKFDIIIDTEQSHYSSAVFAFLNGAKVRCGFNTSRRGHLLTHKTDYNQHDYEAESFLALYQSLTGEKIPFDPQGPFFPLDDHYRKEAAANISHLKGKKTVVISMGASVPEKRWAPLKYAAVIDWLVQMKINVVLCDAYDGPLCPSGPPGEPADDYLLRLNGKASIPQIAGIIAGSDLFLSGDTGFLHIACGLGIPTVSLFGPGVIEKWAPRGSKHLTITKNAPCAPCIRFSNMPACPNNRICMEQIDAQEVLAGILPLLNPLSPDPVPAANLCPVCRSADDYTHLFDAPSIHSNETFRIGQCPQCGMQKVLDMPQDLGRYYADTPMRKRPGRIHSSLKRILLGKELRRLMRNTDNRRFIDVGGGVGTFARLIHESGHNITAVDSGPDRPVEIEALTDIPYFTIDYNSGYSIDHFSGNRNGTVIVRHVLEHLRDPEEFIRSMTGYGFNEFYVVVPNHRCLQSRLFKQYYCFLDPPLHLWFYSQETLKELFANLGFQTVASGFDTIPGIVASVYRYAKLHNWPDGLCRALHPQGFLSSLSAPLDFTLPNNVIWAHFKKTDFGTPDVTFINSGSVGRPKIKTSG